jgi:protein phosphatase PTC7
MDSDTMVLFYVKESMSRLSRFFSLANSKLHRRKNHRLYRITFKKTSGLSSTFVYLYNKDQSKQMHYSISSQEYFLELWLEPHSEFCIKQQGRQFLVDSYPQVTNKSGKIVNLTQKPKKFEVFSLHSKLSRTFSKNLFFESAGYSVGKHSNLNEDAFFCNELALGIADGIGSLKSEFGISSRDFSHELMNKSEYFSQKLMKSPKKAFTCKNIIKNAYQAVEAGGSATFLLALLSGRQLNILNLGDSGLILARSDGAFKVVFQTTPKLHNSITPYQLTKKFSQRQLLASGLGKNLEKSDEVADADEFVITALPGDVLVLGSDGLWDNLHPAEIVKILEQYSWNSVEKLAAIITKIAKIRTVGFNGCLSGVNSLMAKYSEFVGGKPDDITVIVARIVG